MTSLAGHPFRKMNGLGNEFVVLDLRQSKARMTEDAAKLIADPKTGPGCDQVITLENRPDASGVFMGVWNADGSEVGACGNAAAADAERGAVALDRAAERFVALLREVADFPLERITPQKMFNDA